MYTCNGNGLDYLYKNSPALTSCSIVDNRGSMKMEVKIEIDIFEFL